MNPVPPKTFVIFHHPKVENSLALAEEMTAFIQKSGGSAQYSSIDDEARRAQAGEADMLIALGGDGTMLRAGRTGAFNNQPVLGINLGRLGYLVDVQPDEWREMLLRVLRGDFHLEERMMLHASHVQNGATLRSHEVLNEAVISRGTVVRPIRLHTSVDGTPLTTYVADGLIIATPTGSTAYALAAGGPVLPPEARNILLVPIAPHLSLERPIILPADMVVEVTVRTEHQAIFSSDGQTSTPLQDHEAVRVRASRYVARFVRMTPPTHFYQMLAERMMKNPTANKAK
ncbi:MAG: NAD(+)/NADH kinase [Chloroflexi bacterium]|nr:NAD(+)/NADH kinase [Chloroflexota bacterium]